MRRSVTPTRWRVMPTMLLVVSALAMGAISVGAEAPDRAPTPVPASGR